MTDTVWKPVPGHEGLYDISNLGEVVSLPRVVRRGSRPYTTKRHTMTQTLGNDHGHLKVCLTGPDGKARHYWVHRLVALVFCERGEGQDYVLHGPNGPSDNRASELRWGTALDNAADAKAHGTAPVYVPPTHCSAGHTMTEENTYIPPNRGNERVCRECSRSRSREWRRRNPKPRVTATPPPRPCEHCGESFTPKRRSDARLCSSACKSKHHRAA